MKLQNEWWCVRHGQAENNIKPTISSPEEGYRVELTDLGRQQTAHFTIQDSSWDIIISSPYLRAQETAEIFAHAAEVEVLTESAFVELNFGDYVGRQKEEYLKFRKDNSWDTPYPNGESLKEAGERVWIAIQKWDQKYQGKRILLVAHALALTGLECLLTGHLRGRKDDPRNAEPFPMPEAK